MRSLKSLLFGILALVCCSGCTTILVPSYKSDSYYDPTPEDPEDKVYEKHNVSFEYLDTSGGARRHSSLIYSDGFFSLDANRYSPALSSASIAITMAAFGDVENNDFANADRNIKKLFSELNFSNYHANADFLREPRQEGIGAAFATRKVEGRTVIAVALRGGGYRQEWHTDALIGERGDHKGFSDAKAIALRDLKDYISSYNIHGPISLWMTGYSRSGSVANLLAGALDDDQTLLGNQVSFTPKNIYAYTFEATNCTVAQDANDSRYSNIHNVINPDDLLPRFPMEDFGFRRYGIDHRLPTARHDKDYDAHRKAMLALLQDDLRGPYSAEQFVARDFDIYGLMGGAKAFVPSRSHGNHTPCTYFDLAMRYASEKCIVSRPVYVRNAEEEVSDALTLIFGGISNPDEVERILKDGLLRYYQANGFTAVTSLVNRLYRGEREIADTLRPYIQEAANAINPNFPSETLVKTISVTAYLFGKSIKDRPELIGTIIGNIQSVFYAHYPEINRAWLQSMDREAVENPIYYDGGNLRYCTLSFDSKIGVSLSCKGEAICAWSTNGKLNTSIQSTSEVAYGVYRDGTGYLSFPVDDANTYDLRIMGKGGLRFRSEIRNGVGIVLDLQEYEPTFPSNRESKIDYYVKPRNFSVTER